MMKSYKSWKKDKYLKEWSYQNPINNRGFSHEEKANLERLGNILGFNKSWWNIHDKDSHIRADEIQSKLKSIVSGQGNVHELLKEIPSNSPFMIAYREMNAIKKTIGGGNLNEKEVDLLMDILLSSHKSGTVPFAKLNEFWRRVTDATNQSNKAARKIALTKDIYTPSHLLMTFFNIGGGIFSAPDNMEELEAGSERIMKQFFPGKYKELYRNKFHTDPPSFSQPPTAQVAKVDPQIIDALQKALANPQQMATMIANLLQHLQKTP